MDKTAVAQHSVLIAHCSALFTNSLRYDFAYNPADTDLKVLLDEGEEQTGRMQLSVDD